MSRKRKPRKKRDMDKIDKMIKTTEKVMVFFSLIAAFIILNYYFSNILGC